MVVVARPGLGTINHTLLTLKAAREAGLRGRRGSSSAAGPPEPSVLERSNRETIAALGEVEVATLPPLPGPDPSCSPRPARELPWREWLS